MSNPFAINSQFAQVNGVYAQPQIQATMPVNYSRQNSQSLFAKNDNPSLAFRGESMLNGTTVQASGKQVACRDICLA